MEQLKNFLQTAWRACCSPFVPHPDLVAMNNRNAEKTRKMLRNADPGYGIIHKRDATNFQRQRTIQRVAQDLKDSAP